MKRGMDAVIAKSGRRKPLMRRKGAEPSIVIALGGPPPKTAVEDAPEPDAESDALTCPKCGAQLANTDENRGYVAAREMEDADDDMDDDMDDDTGEGY